MKSQLAIWFALLYLLSTLGDPTNLVSLPVLFVLKDHLHLGPQAIAWFDAVIFIPYYGAVLFGILRDRWRPPKLGDRGYIMFAGALAVGCYAWLAVSPVSYGSLLVGMFAAMAAYQMIDVAELSISTVVAQRISITGRLSALAEGVETLVISGSLALGGWIAARHAPHVAFGIAALVTAVMVVQVFWRPAAVFPDHHPPPRGEKDWRFLKRLLRSRSVWPAAVILLLYNFSPGWGTPLLYYLTDKAGLSPQAFGVCRAVQHGSVLAISALYVFLCKRVPLGRLLRWAVALNVLPGFLFLAVHGAAQGVAVAAVVGMVSGFANVALFDLLMRSCPQGLEGTAGMIGHSAFGLAGTASDLLGAALYEKGGFVLCLAMDAAATMLIFPILAQVPREISAVAESQPAAATGAPEM